MPVMYNAGARGEGDRGGEQDEICSGRRIGVKRAVWRMFCLWR